MKAKRSISFLLVLFLAVGMLGAFSDAQAVSGGWRHNSSGWWYQDGNGSWPAGEWRQIGGRWYHFDDGGYMQTGWLRDGGSWYYLQASGAMKTGWLNSGGKWYFLKPSGAMAVGWRYVGGAWYYFSASGAMQTGWLHRGGAWYYLDSSGAMVTGTRTIGGKSYTFGSDGAWIEESGVTPSSLGLPKSFIFSSGVGGWATGLEIGEDWSFTGDFHDSDMGASGDGYQATVYYCSFHGQFTQPVKVKDGVYSMHLVYLETEDEPGESYISENALYVASDPYGMDDADEFLIYLPFTDHAELDDGFGEWAHRLVSFKYFLPKGVYGLYNVGGREGFVGFSEDYGG